MESGEDAEEWSFEELSDTEEETTIILLKPMMIKVTLEELSFGRHAELLRILKNVKNKEENQ